MTLSGNFWIHPCIRLPDFSAGTSIPNFIKMQRKHTRTQAPHYAFILSTMCKECIVDSAKHRTQTSWHTGWTTGVRFPAGVEYFFPPPRLDRLWDPSDLLKQAGREADHSHPSMPRLRMRGAILPLPHTSSWRGASLCTGTSALPYIPRTWTLTLSHGPSENLWDITFFHPLWCVIFKCESLFWVIMISVPHKGANFYTVNAYI